MWFDVVDKIINSKTFIIALHDGSHAASLKLQPLETVLKQANIHNVKLLSLKSHVGLKIAETYSITTDGGLVILRANKQIAWAWLGQDMPALSELIHRYHQVG